MTLDELQKIYEEVSSFLDPEAMKLRVIRDDYELRWTDPILVSGTLIRQSVADKLIAARTHLPKLIAELKAAREVVEEYRAWACSPESLPGTRLRKSLESYDATTLALEAP